MIRIGFLGLGIMGRGMCANLLRAGYPVTVWNRTPGRAGFALDLGAEEATTPAQVVSVSDVTIAMVSDPAASREICLGPDGVLAGMAPGKGYVDMSTVDPATSSELSAAVAGAGGRFVEAPVSGTKKPAADGTLVILAAGDESLLIEVAPLFEIMGKATYTLDKVGDAARMKLVVNLIMGGMVASFSEGLALAGTAGLDPAGLLDVLADGALANPMFAGKGPLMLAGKYEAAFPLKHLQKDLRLAAELAGDCGQSLTVGEAALERCTEAMAANLGDLDICALFRALQV